MLSDGRDLDAGERLAIEASRLRHVESLKALADALPMGPIYVHFDTDVITSEEVPAFHYPAGGGPTVAEVMATMELLNRTGRVIAASMTLGRPELDSDFRAQEACLAAFRALLR